MSSSAELKEGPITIADLLDAYPRLGIPHFQRGLVWGSDAVSLLLESLFHDTPCGTIILWEPHGPDPRRNGIPLGRDGAIRYLIIDGQQRIRSLHGVFAAGESEGGADETEDGTVWCLNLVRALDLNGLLDRRLEGHSLFMKVLPSGAKNAQFKHGIVPLAMLLAAQEPHIDWDPFIPGENRAAVVARIEERQLRRRVGEMRKRKLYLIVKAERGGENSLSEVVRLYNRINSGGKKVESEERAFATLTSIWPGANDWISRLFKAVHREDDGTRGSGAAGRDEVLARKKERSFGFKLFIRTFIQACSYHLGYSVGSSSFSFDVASRSDFQQALSDPRNARDFETICESTERCILAVHTTLSGVHCDALQMLPDAESLLPVFQVLIRFPDVLGQAGHEGALQSLVLRMLLAETSTREKLALVRSVNEAESFEECAAALRKQSPLKATELEDRLEDSNSHQDRYLLLFYWMLRERKAEDFTAGSIDDPEKRAALEAFWKDSGRRLHSKMKPEKQHMVPYSKLRGAYGLAERTRQSRHAVNNIGNLTYISSDLNGLGGLADTPVALGHESEDNLRAHFLLEQDRTKATSPLGQLYARACKSERRAFEDFCAVRRRWIARSFLEWLNKLDGAAPQMEVEPAEPLLASPKIRAVRDFELPLALEERLVRWVRKGATVKLGGEWLTIEPEELEGGTVRISQDAIVVNRAALAGQPGLLADVENYFPEAVEAADGSVTFSKAMPEERVHRLLEAMEAMAAVVRNERA
jgi:hypothetical protein